MPSKKKTHDSILEELESLINQLDQDELPLNKSLDAFERGIKLTRIAQENLTEAEQKVQVLLAQHGSLVTKDLPSRNED